MNYCYHCMTQLEDKKLNTCPNCGKSLTPESLQPRYLKPGTVLKGRFVVGYPLGAGGFGNTYIGWDQVLLRKVAIKEFYPEQYSGRTMNGVSVSVANKELEPRFQYGLHQFLEEARSVAALQDIKGVVKISNFFEENSTGYIIMEYLEGMDVKTILKKSGNKKDYEWSRRVILTVLHTLREIHKRGVIHRDISPDNIFVTSEGVIKLIDFGAAKHASATESMSADVVLKPGYAPLEQYSRDAKQGPYTDLYAVAALFYRMIVGQKPMPASERIDEDPLIPPSEMGIEIPEQAEMGMMVCLNVKPEYRLQSADDFMETLDGKDFVPIYEPEWILPADYGKKSMKSRFAALPMGMKALICVAVLAVAGGAVAGGMALTKTEEQKSVAENAIRMQDLSGKKKENVDKILLESGVKNLNDVKIKYEYKLDSANKDTIIDQSLETGAAIEKGQEITITLSGGDEVYTIPDFSKMNKNEICDYFKGNGFNIALYDNPYDKKGKVIKQTAIETARKGQVAIKTVFADKSKKAGTILKQSEDAGKDVSPSDNVTVEVAIGGQKKDFIKTLPKLTGCSMLEAKNRLKKAGLSGVVKLKEGSEEYSSIAKGTTLTQSKKKGMKINLLKLKMKKKKITVSVAVSKGERPKPVETPKPTQKPVETKKPTAQKNVGKSSKRTGTTQRSRKHEGTDGKHKTGGSNENTGSYTPSNPDNVLK